MDAIAPSMPAAALRPAAGALGRARGLGALIGQSPAEIETLAARVFVELLLGVVRARLRPGLAPGLAGHLLTIAISLGLAL
jgi:hypothetical protein